MKKKFSEILKLMIERTGVSVTDATIKTILDNPVLATIEVDEAVSNKLLQEMLTLEAAKQNPELVGYFRHSILGGLDAELERGMTKFELPDDAKAAIKAEKSSYARAILLADKVKELTEKKVGAGSKDKTALDKEIEKLNGELATLKQSFETEKNNLLGGFAAKEVEWRRESVYSNFIPKMDKKYNPKVNLNIIKTTVTEALQKDGLKVVDKEGNLTLLTAADTEYFDKTSNVKVGFEDYVTKTLANEKLLVASEGPVKKDSIKVETTPSNNGSGLNFGKMESALTD